MDALVAEYGEEDVMRWCETGRLLEEVLPKIAEDCWNSEIQCYGRHWYIEGVDQHGFSVTNEVFSGDSPLDALRKAAKE